MQYAKRLPSYQRMYAQDPVRAEGLSPMPSLNDWTMKARPPKTDFERLRLSQEGPTSPEE